MAKANSFKSSPWTGLEKCPWAIFEDDFINNKIAFKVNTKSLLAGASIKSSFTLKDNHIDKLAEEVGVWFPSLNNTYYFLLRSNAWKLHIDHGLYERSGTVYNLYSSIQGSKQIGDETIKAGF
jgi:hypothetical protein